MVGCKDYCTKITVVATVNEPFIWEPRRLITVLISATYINKCDIVHVEKHCYHISPVYLTKHHKGNSIPPLGIHGMIEITGYPLKIQVSDSSSGVSSKTSTSNDSQITPVNLDEKTDLPWFS